MVYLFGSPRCPAPQSLSVSCNKFGKSMVHTNLTYLETKPVRGSRNCRAFSPSKQAHNLKKSTNKILQATKQSKHPFGSRLSDRISQIIPPFPSQGLYCRQSKYKRLRQLIITKHLRRSIIRRQRRKQGHYSEEDLPLFLQTIRRYCRPKLIAALTFTLRTFCKALLIPLQLFQAGKSFIFKD